MPRRRKATLPGRQWIARTADIHPRTWTGPRRTRPLRIGVADTRANPQCAACHGACTYGRNDGLRDTHQVDSFDRHTRDVRECWSFSTPNVARLPTGSYGLNACSAHQFDECCQGRIDAVAIVGGDQIKQQTPRDGQTQTHHRGIDRLGGVVGQPVVHSAGQHF